jgi:hypothetical protein
MSRTPLDEMYHQAVHDYLKNITDKGADNDLVFMMDALDTWFQLSPQILTERFHDLGTSGVLIGADKWCYPNPLDSVSS